jgi:hypothetical protein
MHVLNSPFVTLSSAVQVEWIYENGTREKGDPEKGERSWLFKKNLLFKIHQSACFNHC